MRRLWLSGVLTFISACSTQPQPILSLSGSEIVVSVPEIGSLADQNREFQGFKTQVELAKLLNQRLLMPPSLAVQGMDQALVYGAPTADERTQAFLVLGQSSAVLVLEKLSPPGTASPQLGIDATELFQNQGLFQLLELKSSARGEVALATTNKTPVSKRDRIGRIQAFLR